MKENTGNNTVVKSFAWKLMERVLAQGINFLVQVILARLLLPEDFASLAIIVAITNYATILVQAGLSTAIVQKENLEPIDVSTLLVASLAAAFVLYVGVFAASPIIAQWYRIPELNWALRVQGLILFLHAINSVQLAVLQRGMQFKQIFIRSIVAVPVAGLIGVVMAFFGCGVWALVTFNLANIFLNILVIFIVGDMHIGFGFSWESAKSMYKFSGKIMMASLISGLYDTVRTMVIGRKYSSDDLAYYDKAYTYSLYAVSTVGYSISGVMLPVLSRQQNDIKKLKETARQSIQVSTFVMFPVLFGILAVAQPLVLVLLTEKWVQCAPFLMLFCVLRLPECMITIDKQAYYALGKSGICLIYEIGLCIFNLIALILTLEVGITAIAVGAVTVQLIAGMVICFISYKTYGYTVLERIKDLAKPFANSVIMAALVWMVQLLNFNPIITLVFGAAIGVVAYILLAFITRDKNLILALNLLRNLLKMNKSS